ncbi:MAG: FlgD immunoglobulin-like domain containing protein, partial [Syntrophothermus sp.]
SGLVLRLRADTEVTQTSGRVSLWGNTASATNDASQPTPADQPLLVENSMNGQPVIRFDRTNTEFLYLVAPSALGISNQAYEMFFVARSNTVDVQFLIGGASERYELHLDGDAGLRFIPNAAIYADKGTAGNYTDNKAHLLSARISAASAIVRVDGEDGETESGDHTAANNDACLGVGCRTVATSTSSFLNGDIAEILIYNRVLTSGERADVEAYAAARYGITTGALPVEMSSLSAAVKDFKAVLNWETATEVSNYGFEIERSEVNGKPNAVPEYVKAGFVNGSGNSNSKKSYTFTDQAVSAGSYLYRIKQVDINGTYKYYGPVSVNIESPDELVLFQNSPNPFNPVTAISYNLPKQENVTLKIYDQLGRLVITLTDEVKQAGSHVTYWNGRDSHGNIVSSGVYLYRLTAGEYSQARKMNFAK